MSISGHVLFVDNDITTWHRAAREKRGTFPSAMFDSLFSLFFPFFFLLLSETRKRARKDCGKSYRALAERKRSGNGRSCALGECMLYPANVVARQIRNGSSRIYELELLEFHKRQERRALHFSTARARIETFLVVRRFFLFLSFSFFFPFFRSPRTEHILFAT